MNVAAPNDRTGGPGLVVVCAHDEREEALSAVFSSLPSSLPRSSWLACPRHQRVADLVEQRVWQAGHGVPANDGPALPGMALIILGATSPVDADQSRVDGQRALAALQALEEISDQRDEFLSLVSHELRTPLVPLVGYSDALLELAAEKEREAQPSWDPCVGEYVGKFVKQLKRLEKLTDDLLDLARLESGKFTLELKEIDVRPLVTSAVEEARLSTQKQRIDVKLPPEPAHVRGDEDRLGQVLANLLGNAIKHAADSPRIEVEVGLRQGWIDVAVRDHGPGIPQELLRRLFTRFYQVAVAQPPRRGGLGLGLFIARTIVRQHGGDLLVESGVARGSTFTIRLPRLASP